LAEVRSYLSKKVVVLPLKVEQKQIGLQVVTSKHLLNQAPVKNLSVPEVKAGQVNGVKQLENDGDADENTKI